MIPARPRLRPLEAFPVRTSDGAGGQSLCLRDPSGLAEGVAILPPAAVAVVVLCDGSRDVGDIQSELFRRLGELVPRPVIERLLEQLDEGLLLDSPRFAEHHAKVIDDFRAAPRREAAFAGASYPALPAELGAFLDGFFTGDGGPGVAPRRRAGGTLRALVAPHIDFHRGGPSYARSYLPLHDLPAPPELVVVLGTDHNGIDQPFTLTRKSYATPLGELPTDVELVETLRERAGGDALFADELHHRNEHSIELQAVAVRHAWPETELRLLPILVGSFHRFVGDGGAAVTDPASDPHVARFLDQLGELTAGRRALFIAGADLAHVGPRFGDERPLSEADRTALVDADAESLEQACRGDAFGFFRSVADDGDARRVCGLGPVYALLRIIGRVAGSAGGRVLAYDQCPADEDGGSLVSIAGVAWG